LFKNVKVGGFKETQIKYVIIGGLSGFAGGTPAFLLTLNILIPPYAIILFAIYPFIFAYAIVKHHLMDIETVIHKTLMWLVASSVIFAPIVLLAYWLQPWYSRTTPLNVAFLCGLIFYLLTLYLKFIQPKVDHFFQRRKYDLQKASEKFTLDLVYLKSPSQLITKIQESIKDTLYTQEVFVHISSSELSLEDPFLSWLTQNDTIAYKDFIDIDPQYEPIRNHAARYFNETGSIVAVPLVLDRKLLGVINLSKKSNLKHYSSYDFQFLMRLKNEATIALSNSLLYGRVEEEVQIRTQQLIDTQKQLIQSEKLATVGTLAGGVAHEINNPLAAILTNAQMLSMDATKEEDKESLKLIEEAAKRCRSIVQKLMVYSRKPLGGREITEIDLEKALNNVLSLLSYQLGQENIKINKRLQNPPFIITGSQNELEQVFTNLILNAKDAIKHKKKSGQIDVSITRQGKQMIIKVKDDGIGISKEHISKIFDPFYTTKDVGKGTGLGLSICHSIIEGHKGTISAESKEGQGSTFIVILPVKIQ
jgi:signal transduction histidine kinase